MSKYASLWAYIGGCGKESLTLSFEEIEEIAGVPMDHAFLKYKKELAAYGYEVKKIFLKEKKAAFIRIAQPSTLVLYVHGKGGMAEEGEYYKPLFPNCDVAGLDYKAETPWDAEKEFPSAVEGLFQRYKSVILIANSIGAYFSMCALPQKKVEKAYFISPIVDMEKLILNMMDWAQITEENLREKGRVETNFGETLSWDYLCYVRRHPVNWQVPTEILYGGRDNLTSLETVAAFANAHQADLTVMEQGEHWFHTEEQMDFLRRWIQEKEGMKGTKGNEK